jgi:hypothetical protein
LLCLLAALSIFLVGYAKYLNVTLSGKLLEGDQLERLKDVFHPRWLVGLMLAGIVILVIALVELAMGRRRGGLTDRG